VDSRSAPEKEVCPKCGKKKVKQGYVSTNGSAPSMKMDDNMAIDKYHNEGGFADAMERVCQSPTVKGTKYEAELRAKHLTK
tara:strand:- start:146 stop:388 length:243 start_codon:yes stop_codon:yes gene_type:complete